MAGNARSGFASFDHDDHREASRKGGRRLHELGKAHQYQPGSKEASDAGRKGGLERARRAAAAKGLAK